MNQLEMAIKQTAKNKTPAFDLIDATILNNMTENRKMFFLTLVNNIL